MRISVVIPSRDDAQMLRECLSALTHQTHPVDELIVVDNGSSDDTADVARDAGARVVYEAIAGIPRASAAGYDAASGEVIARLDADSVPPPTWLAQIEERFTDDTQLSFLTGSGRFYGASDRVHRRGERYYLGGLFWAMTPYLGHPPLFGSNFAMRRTAWEQLSGEVHRDRRDIHDDLDLSLCIRPWMRVAFDPELLVGVSARPFATLSGFSRRIRWVVPTLRLHWPEENPWRRRRARRRAGTAAHVDRGA
jgi:glycosyltransferase involved in cell wall biosynthesis